MAIMGDVSDEMRDKLINQAREVARTMAVSHKEAAESYYYLASAGLSAAESLEAMPKVARLAEAAQLDMATATDIAVNSLRGFGMAVSDLGHVTDVLTGTVTATNTNMLQLGEALKYVAPVAHSVGWSIEEVSAALGILANAGIKGSQAGTGLRRVLSELLNPSDRAKDVLAKLGLTMDDLNPKTHSLTEIMKKLKDAGASTSDIMAIFGDRGGIVALRLMDAANATEQLTQKLKEAKGTTEEIAKEQEQGLNAQLKILKNNMNDLAITIGEQLAPTIKDLADKLKEMANDKKTVEFAKELGEGMASAFTAMADAFTALAGVMDRLPGGTGKALGALIALVAVISPIIVAVGFLAQALAALAPIAGAVSGAMSAIVAVLGAIAGAISLPIVLIGLLIAAIVALVFNIGGARDKLMDFLGWIKDGLVSALTMAKDAIVRVAGAVKTALTAIATASAEYGPKALAKAKEIGHKIIDGIKQGLSKIKEAVAEKLNKIKTALTELPGKIKNAAEGIGRAIVNGIKNGLSNLASTLKNALLGPLQDAVNDAKSMLGIGSPSKVFAEIGKNVVEGYELGVENAARKLKPILPAITVEAPGARPTAAVFNENRAANVSITLNGVAIRQDEDIDRLADAIEDKLGRRLAW